MYKEDEGKSDNPWVEMRVAEMAQRREANRRYRDNKKKRRQEMEKSGLVKSVTRRGDKIDVVMLLEPGGGLWKKFETRRTVLMEINVIVGEIVEEVNGIRRDGEEWVKLIGASKSWSMKGDDVSMTLELMSFARELSKPEIKALIEIGIKKFLRRPEIDPKDYLRGPG